MQALHEELSSLDIRLKAQDVAAQALRGELRALQPLREEFRAALLARRNGNGAGTHIARAVLHKNLANGHAVKERRKSDVVTH